MNREVTPAIHPPAAEWGTPGRWGRLFAVVAALGIALTTVQAAAEEPAAQRAAGAEEEHVGPAGKASEKAEEETESGVFSIQYENDVLAGTDRHYTNGVRLTYVSPKLRDQIPFAREALQWLYPFDPGADARVGVSLGQSMFTPNDIEVEELIPDDRPYAGWLYAGFFLNVEGEQDLLGTDFDVLDTLEVDLGVVGPASLAEDTQKFVHEILDVTDPQGWDNQLENEPGILLILERKLRTPALELGPFEADAIPSAGISLGNIETSANLGGMVRIGQGLQVDYGPPMIRPNLAGRAFFERVQRPFNWYVFAGADGRFVVRDIFLDGNTFRDSHSVDKKNLVGAVEAGVAAVYHGVRLTFSYVLRTREFDGQNSPDRFGAVSLSFRF